MAKNVGEELVHNSLAAGTEITGDIKINGNIRFDGILNGSIEVSSKLVLGQSGKVNGNIICEEADILGVLEGNILCSKLLSLKSSSNISGEIKTKTLSIEPGVIFNGSCTMIE